MKRLTGADGFTTCPRAYAWLPWVARAVRAWSYREKGSLSVVEPRPPAALIPAIDLVSRGHDEAMEAERKREESQRKGDDEQTVTVKVRRQ